MTAIAVPSESPLSSAPEFFIKEGKSWVPVDRAGRDQFLIARYPTSTLARVARLVRPRLSHEWVRQVLLSGNVPLRVRGRPSRVFAAVKRPSGSSMIDTLWATTEARIRVGVTIKELVKDSAFRVHVFRLLTAGQPETQRGVRHAIQVWERLTENVGLSLRLKPSRRIESLSFSEIRKLVLSRMGTKGLSREHMAKLVDVSPMTVWRALSMGDGGESGICKEKEAGASAALPWGVLVAAATALNLRVVAVVTPRSPAP